MTWFSGNKTLVYNIVLVRYKGLTYADLFCVCCPAGLSCEGYGFLNSAAATASTATTTTTTTVGSGGGGENSFTKNLLT